MRIIQGAIREPLDNPGPENGRTPVQSVSLRRTEKRRFLEGALIGRSFPQSALKAILSLYKIAIRMIVEVGWMILIAMCCFAASRFSSVPRS